MFPELVAHPCTLTNMRGLFGDVIADQVMGYVLCFARNLHTYIRRQVEHRYEPLGGESARVSNADRAGDGQRDGPGDDLPARTRRWGSSASARIGCEIAERAMAFGMTVRGVDRFPERVEPPAATSSSVRGSIGSPTCWLERLRRHRRAADARDDAACSTPGCSPTCSRRGYLINIGRGAIVVLDDLVDRPPRRPARRGGARRLRGRAAARRPSALGLPQRDPHPAHRRLFAGDRRPAPGDAGRERRPVRPRRGPEERRRQGGVVLISR